MKKKPKFNLNASVRGSIRRVFSRSPIVREVLWAGRKEYVKYNKDGSVSRKPGILYSCEVCKKYCPAKMISVDHIIPVISVTEGFKSWDEFVARLFCGIENLQRICDNCHKIKTNSERQERDNKKDTILLEEIKKDILCNPSDEYKKILKRMSERDAEIYQPIKKEAQELLLKYYPKKKKR